MPVPPAWRALALTLLGEPELTSGEVANAADVELPDARRLWHALGFPPVPGDDQFFTRSDVAMLASVRALLQRGVHADALVQLARVAGQAMARVAEAQVAAVASDGDDPEVVVARESVLTYAWRRHLVAALLRAATAEDRDASDVGLTVGFADLVGFTAITRHLSQGELAATVDRFEAIAYEQIPLRGGRVVKMIGDEVMFAADDGAVAAEMALGLVDACARDDLVPDVRVGLAAGPVVSWEGDLYGPTVNLASRLVDTGRPGSVLVSDDLGRELAGNPAFVLRHLRAVKLKGIGRVRAWVLRRATT